MACPMHLSADQCQTVPRHIKSKHMAYLPQIMKLQVKQKIASLACPSKRMLWKS
ncbi:hypothetical protein FOXG_19038 [Fusarium oxysporum f. sp. lycopersici 4287]|uniref:Uncharacterized protein n=2 Tax=Fusarium oxysporum TaxID=5507 RepID=A0A0J9UVF6_FUSO4|nr:hypothetical protein FOXG_19038 [Fusarium oxysporum f. sp. lycopersici 4287]EXK39431.1 hypothetical protein FOMG_06737 [Fusarium oxysporum f. sp. melonis 26406]KNB02481.1 hypothetical protein FOXG_19038 [Fusarium oxysporum f. sp. lycopersici 4287]